MVLWPADKGGSGWTKSGGQRRIFIYFNQICGQRIEFAACLIVSLMTLVFKNFQQDKKKATLTKEW